MDQSHFKAFLLMSLLLLSLHLPQGYGRTVRVVRNQEKPTWAGRTMVEVVNDYREPGANTNPRTANLFNNPHSPPRA